MMPPPGCPARAPLPLAHKPHFLGLALFKAEWAELNAPVYNGSMLWRLLQILWAVHQTVRWVKKLITAFTADLTALYLHAGLAVGCAAPVKGLLFGPDPPLNFLTDSLDIMAGAMIPCMMLVLGSVLHKGPGSGQVPWKVILGILGMRQIVIPFLGTLQ